MMKKDSFANFGFRGNLASFACVCNQWNSLDYSPRTIAGPQIVSPMISNRHGFSGYFPLYTPHTPVMQNNSLANEAEELNPGAIDNKMDKMLNHLKKEINSNTTAASKGIVRGRGQLMIETDTSVPTASDQVKYGEDGLNLNMDLINDQYPANQALNAGVSNAATMTPNGKQSVPFSPGGSLFKPRSRNSRGFS